LPPCTHEIKTVETMRFGETVRALRTAQGLSLRDLGKRVGVSYAYISKVENGKLDFGDYPSANLIRRLAQVLGGDEEMMLLAAEKIPETIRRRLFERPDAFRQIARLDDEALDRLLITIAGDKTPGGSERFDVRRA
jgi:HTH-type transcriptional regulator, competence development regulator